VVPHYTLWCPTHLVVPHYTWWCPTTPGGAPLTLLLVIFVIYSKQEYTTWVVLTSVQVPILDNQHSSRCPILSSLLHCKLFYKQYIDLNCSVDANLNLLSIQIKQQHNKYNSLTSWSWHCNGYNEAHTW